jgi:hypothetical protein
MSSRTPLDALFAGYLHDLVSLSDMARHEQAAGMRSAASLVGKLALEAMRISVYERQFLLPVAAEVLDDGPARVDQELKALDGLEEHVLALEGLEVASPRGGEVLSALADYAAQLAQSQRHGILPALADALPVNDLTSLAARVTPTQEPGATHSHPKLPAGHDITLWPGIGMTSALRTALTDEASSRAGA